MKCRSDLVHFPLVSSSLHGQPLGRVISYNLLSISPVVSLHQVFRGCLYWFSDNKL